MAYLSNFENGKVNITIASLYQIAKALDVSVKALLATEEDKNILVVPSDKRFAIVEDTEQEFPPIQEFLTRGASFDMQVTVMHMSPHTDFRQTQDRTTARNLCMCSKAP
jgi:transcriptional regulator with XRE-family HTH domain